MRIMIDDFEVRECTYFAAVPGYNATTHKLIDISIVTDLYGDVEEAGDDLIGYILLGEFKSPELALAKTKYYIEQLLINGYANINDLKGFRLF